MTTRSSVSLLNCSLYSQSPSLSDFWASLVQFSGWTTALLKRTEKGEERERGGGEGGGGGGGGDCELTICSSCEVRKIELDLIPAFVQSHGHCADEWLDSCCRLHVRVIKAAIDLQVMQILLIMMFVLRVQHQRTAKKEFGQHFSILTKSRLLLQCTG